MERFRTRLCILLSLALALAATMPALAFAASPRPSAIATDTWESDDTSATAKILPARSFHTLKARGTTLDQDWSVQTIDETGAPFLVDVTQRQGWCLPLPMVFREEAEAEDGLAAAPYAPVIWGGIGLPASILVRAPLPGRYFTAVTDAFTPWGGGAYTQVQKRGLAFRLGGYDRYETAAAVSRQMWPAVEQDLDKFLSVQGAYPISSPAGCVLATGRSFPDALAATAWIARPNLPEQRMPVLLTERDYLPYETFFEIFRLSQARRRLNLPFTVYVVGDESVVSERALDWMHYLDYYGEDSSWAYAITDIVRIAGPDRFATASAVASKAVETAPSDTVFIANGFAFPDALSAGPVAANSGASLLLVRKGSIPQATAKFITEHPSITKAVVVGSSSVVADSVVASLSAPPFSLQTTRVFGVDRYDTSRKVAQYGIEQCEMNPSSIVLATGANYPDGLTAAGLTGFTRGPLLLTRPDVLSPSVADHYAQFPTMAPSYIVGGEAAIRPRVMDAFDNLWRTVPLQPTAD